MKIYLVRHAETDANRNGIMQGQSENLQINDKGIIDARIIKMQLSKINFKKCYTSPLIRCWSTAMIVAGDRTEIIEDKNLIERYLGNYEGKHKDTYDINKYWDYNLNSDDGGVEPIQDIFDRCNNFLESIKDKYNDEDNILIVSHSGVIRTLYHIINKTDLNSNLVNFDINNCFYKELEFK